MSVGSLIGIEFDAPKGWRTRCGRYKITTEPIADVFGKQFVWVQSVDNPGWDEVICHLEWLERAGVKINKTT